MVFCNFFKIFFWSSFPFFCSILAYIVNNILWSVVVHDSVVLHNSVVHTKFIADSIFYSNSEPIFYCF